MQKELLDRQRQFEGKGLPWSYKLFHPMILDELLHMSYRETEGGTIGVQMTLAMIRNEFPWIYETGIETLSILKSSVSVEQKENAIGTFTRIVEFTFEHPIIRGKMERSKEWHIVSRELPRMLGRGMHSLLKG